MADFTAEQLALIQKMYEIQGPDLELFLYTCKRTGLDPLARQIYAIQRGGKMTIQTGIDGYRVIADRTGKLAGISDYLFDSEDKPFPAKATVTVRKLMDAVNIGDFTATARWGEYQAGGPMWKKMPYLMLGKCAEALALRKAFPADLSGVYTTEEMAQADNPVADAVFAEVERQKGSQAPQDAPQAILPPELDWQYNRASGVLLCRIMKAETAKTKSGSNAGKEYVKVTVNNELDKGKGVLLYYWHATHRDLLLAAKGMVAKLMITAKEKGFTVDRVLEINHLIVPDPPAKEEDSAVHGETLPTGKRGTPNSTTTAKTITGSTGSVPPVAGIKPIGDPETQARLLASVFEMTEQDLVDNLRLCKGSWQGVMEFLQREQARREVTA